MKTLFNTFFIAAITILTPIFVWAYSGNPPNEKTGAPGEGTCVDCHSSFPLNSGDGTLTISGPETFRASQTYEITIELSDQGQSRWGFEITPLDQGACTITDSENTQHSSSGNNSYVKNTSDGTFEGTSNGPVSWTFDWTAPASPPDTVIFYAAGNACDNNSATSGDYIYTTMFATHYVTGIDDYNTGAIPRDLAISNFPNPFNASTTIQFSLDKPSICELAIYNINGRLVKQLTNQILPAGYYTLIWQGVDERNNPVASGFYFAKLSTDYNSAFHRMLLLK